MADAMTESNQTSAVPLSVSKEKKTKIFYEHGKDALALAISVADMQEEKTLRKAERHHQLQATKSGPEQRNRNRASSKRKRLDEAKTMIAKRRADAKKEKARSRRESKSRLQQRHDVNIAAREGDDTSTAPRKRVSFA